MKLLYAKNPRWANRGQSRIDLQVRFEEIAEELPFTAEPNDVEAHGRDIYARAVSGEFGEVAQFEATPPSLEEVTDLMRETRNHKLREEVDPVVSNPLRWADLTPEQQQQYEGYRRALLDFTADPNFPWFSLVVVETDVGYMIDPTLAPWPTLGS